MSKCYTFIYKLKELFVIFKIKVTYTVYYIHECD